jgi:DNA-binding NarL/FixJ family response regulator
MRHNSLVTAVRAFELVGREVELARLSELVATLHEGPRAVAVRGEPGIGKTVLWREAIAAAEAAGVRVLVARCAEAELPLPLGALADLFEPVFDEIESGLAEPHRRALAAGIGATTDFRAQSDRLTLARAALASLRALADRSPVLLAIDDVQWLDESSARVLAFAARRFGGSPVGFLTTLRGGDETTDALGLADAFGPDRFSELQLGPLSMGALQHLVGLRFDLRLPRTTLSAVHRASGGNPMFALEFARAARDEDPRLRPLLPVPASLQALVRDHVGRLPGSMRPLLELVAAMERPSESVLAKVLGGAEATGALLEEAAEAGAVAVDDAGTVRFTHPLLAAAVYYAVTPTRRRALHGRAAAIVDDPVQRARHLALSTADPDAAIAQALEVAAQTAARRGAPEAAATLAVEAVRLTPADDAGARVRRRLAAAAFSIDSGLVETAREQLDPLLDAAAPADVRAQALVLRAETEHRDRKVLRACLREAIDIAADPRVRWQALIRFAQHGGWVSGDAAAAAGSADEALRIARGLGDRALEDAAAAALAYYEAGRGVRRVRFGEEELARAEPLPRTAPWQITPAISVGSRLLWAGELDRAREVLRAEYETLVRQGSLLRLPLVLLNALADLEWRAGNWDVAEQYVAEAHSILEEALPGGLLVVTYARVLLTGSRGRMDEARRLADDGVGIARRYEDRVNELRVRWAIGHAELACGDAAAAWRTLEGLPEALEAFGIAEPGWQPVLPDVVDALVQLGRVDEAEAVVRTLEATSLGHRWAAPAARRGRAALLLAREDSEAAVAAAEAAAAAFEGIGFPLDRARALLVVGAARRRAGQRRRAADALQRALDILAALGAQPWLERAQDDLRRASPRPRRDGELTNAERRVAALVAQGMTNREVAAQLFTTVATVEAHLTRIYRKAGVRSRTKLARAVAEGVVPVD